MKLEPKYPIFIPSKGRSDKAMTISMFLKDDVDFHIVVEPQDVENYEQFGRDRLLILPENDQGLVYARNWIKEYSISQGHERHWQFDDDIRKMRRIYKGYRLPCESGIALAMLEKFVDRYENIALASFNSDFFIPVTGGTARSHRPPFFLNFRCYTCFLMLNSIPNKWRYRYNEDTDMTLQVLADGWCTILFNAYLIDTPETMSYGGGQTPVYVDDGRLKMSRDLERVWPGVVTTRRRYGRPQHRVKDRWAKFDTPLIRRKDVDWKALEEKGANEFGMRLHQVEDEIESQKLRDLIEHQDDE